MRETAQQEEFGIGKDKMKGNMICHDKGSSKGVGNNHDAGDSRVCANVVNGSCKRGHCMDGRRCKFRHEAEDEKRTEAQVQKHEERRRTSEMMRARMTRRYAVRTKSRLRKR